MGPKGFDPPGRGLGCVPCVCGWRCFGAWRGDLPARSVMSRVSDSDGSNRGPIGRKGGGGGGGSASGRRVPLANRQLPSIRARLDQLAGSSGRAWLSCQPPSRDLPIKAAPIRSYRGRTFRRLAAVGRLASWRTLASPPAAIARDQPPPGLAWLGRHPAWRAETRRCAPRKGLQ